MNSFFGVLLVVMIYTSYCGADTHSENSVDPEVPGLCSYKGEYYPPGEHLLPECTRLVCSQRGWASIHSCVESSRQGCFDAKKIAPDQPFPECCKKRYLCRRSNGALYKTISF